MLQHKALGQLINPNNVFNFVFRPILIVHCNVAVADPYPHHFGKLDPDPDPIQSEKQLPDPDPHQRVASGGRGGGIGVSLLANFSL
jgi:hypothetical protein